MTSGALVTHQEPIHQITSYARIYVALSHNHKLEACWETLVTRIAGYIHSGTQPSSVTPESVEGFTASLYFRLDSFRQRLNNTESRLHHYIDRSRQKRGLFDFIGEIGSSLFGIPSPSDINSLKEANEQLATAVEGVVRTQQGIVARVNTLGRVQTQIVKKIHDLTDHQEAQDAALRAGYNARQILSATLGMITKVLRLTVLLDNLEATINQYEAKLAQAQAIRLACEARIVTEQVVPINMIPVILAEANSRASINPLAYYAYIQVEKIITVDDITYCVLKAPIFGDDDQTLIHIRTFPVCKDQRCLHLYQPPPFILNYQTEDLYFPSECHGPVPQACRPGVIYDKAHQPCLHGLVNSDPHQQQQCPITYHSQPPPPGDVTTPVLNQYIVTTERIFYHYRCPGSPPKTADLESGTYVIDIEPRCVMDSGLWMLTGLPTMIINFTVPNSIPSTIPLDWMDIPLNTTSFDFYLPPGVTKLTVPNYEALQAPGSPNIRSRIDAIQANVGKAPVPWWIWLIVAVTSLALAFALYAYLRIRCCPTLPEIPVTYSATDNKVTFNRDAPPRTHPTLEEDSPPGEGNPALDA